jgi:hypothetical protein
VDRVQYDVAGRGVEESHWREWRVCTVRSTYEVCTCVVGERKTGDRSALARYLNGPLTACGVHTYIRAVLIRSSNSTVRGSNSRGVSEYQKEDIRHSWTGGELVGDADDGTDMSEYARLMLMLS